MRLKEYLNEKYWKYVEKNPVFVNPSWKELMELDTHEIRFTAIHDEKRVYVWDANELTHFPISSQIGFTDTVYHSGNVFEGNAEKKGNKYEVIVSDQLAFEKENVRIEILKKDWSWMKKYKIDPITYIAHRRRMYKVKK